MKAFVMKNKWNMVFYFLLITFLLFVLAFATPVIGFFSAKFLFVNELGCNMSSFSQSPCLLFGVDIGDRILPYSAPFIGLLATPIAFFIAFWEVSLLWISLIFLAKIMVGKYERKDTQ